MKAMWQGVVIAESDDTVVVEGNHYFPLESIKSEHLKASEHTSVCGWKGTASYYDVVVGDEVNKDACWYYGDPKDGASEIKGRAAFWKGIEVSE